MHYLVYPFFHRVVSQTYDREQDTFRVIFLILPCLLLGIFINHEFTITEILWTFSIYLEAVAILPQLVLLQRTKKCRYTDRKLCILTGRV